jgi:hypothetical protein
MSIIPTNRAQAAKAYTTHTISHDTTIKGEKATIELKCFYTYVALKGDTKIIRKINKALKPKNYKNYQSAALEYAKSDADDRDNDDTYSDYTVQTVSYLSDSIVSVDETSVWYAGGVQNVAIGGRTFSLKTGNEIKKLTTVTKQKSLSKIKKTLKRLIKKQDENYDTSELDKMKAKDFHFYITKKGKVCVCFGPYELGFGGWTKKFYLASDNL